MKHRIKGRKLNRNSAHRKALLRNLSLALLKAEGIKTTLPKAKELRPFIEKLLTIAKTDNLANRRLAQSILGNDLIIEKDGIKINGSYGETLKSSEIKKIELVNQISLISYKTKGFALSSIKKGYFKTKKGENIKLFVNSNNQGVNFEVASFLNDTDDWRIQVLDTGEVVDSSLQNLPIEIRVYN